MVNAGAPVLLPWLDRARTVLWVWFPGQEMGHALAAVLAGDREAGRPPAVDPSGERSRRPRAARAARNRPAGALRRRHPRGLPRLGALRRHPGGPLRARPRLVDLRLPRDRRARWTLADGDVRVAVTVANTGTRDAREIVQLYLEPPADAALERPVRWFGRIRPRRHPGRRQPPGRRHHPAASLSKPGMPIRIAGSPLPGATGSGQVDPSVTSTWTPRSRSDSPDAQ